MMLAQLLEGVEIRALYGPDPAQVEITGLAHDSRRVAAGALFAALPGVAADGHDFAVAAQQAGAVALLLERPEPEAAGTTQVITPNSRRALARVAEVFYGRPSRELTLVGVTGTNGKTTITYLVEAMLAADDPDRPVGVIGTVETRFGRTRRPAEMTTPESLELSRLLAEMRDASVRRVVMEVSSHALAQHRADGLAFDLGLFTNLSRDHLDYHHDLDDYFAAKRRLFTELLPAASGQGKSPWAVVCVDDPWGRRLCQDLAAADLPMITYGLEPGAQVRGRADQQDLGGARCRISFRDAGPAADGEIILKTTLVGRYNLQNLTGAVAAGLALGLEPRVMARGLAALAGVPGRLQRVGGPDTRPAVFVDYCHTDQALAGALAVLRPLTRGRLICVFGAGGDRDQGKRPLMGRAVAQGADLAVLTSDNPRSEDPLTIMAMVEQGLRQGGAKLVESPQDAAGPAYLKQPDRAAAIALAIAGAGDQDVVLIAGKGHEDYQIVGTTKRHFDDAEQAAAALGLARPAAGEGGHG